MRKKQNMIVGCGLAVFIAGLLVLGAQGKDAPHAKHDGHDAHNKEAIPKPSPKAHHDSTKHHADLSGNIGAALKHLASVEAAVRNGHKDVALKELGKARHLLMQLHAKAKSDAAHGAIKIANVLCPIMDEKINLAKLTAKLTTTYDGKTIGFCCPRCIPSWNKLSAAKKRAKFQASLALPKIKAHSDEHSGHNH